MHAFSDDDLADIMCAIGVGNTFNNIILAVFLRIQS